MLPVIGAAIGGISSLIGGMMNNAAQERVNAENRAATAEANEKNYQAQKEFAQQGLRWKVEDANAAGVHPLYALGAPSQSFSPSYVGSTSQASTSMGEGLSRMGQDIGSAVSATKTTGELAYDAALQGLQLERASLENDLLRSQIMRTTLASRPAFPDASGEVIPPGADLMLGGDRFRTDKGTSPAEAYQTQYGDVVENLVGVPMAVGDLWKHMTRGVMPWLESSTVRRRARRTMEEYNTKRKATPFPYDVYHNSPSAR